MRNRARYLTVMAPRVALATAVLLLASLDPLCAQNSPSTQDRFEVNDEHFHLTNYIQEGTKLRDFLAIMGDKIGRVALFGIPLQQQWSYQNSGDFAPTYYLQTDAPLYYYSFTDAYIAMAFRSLTADQQARFDPMITGFNPADMYAADHIRRVLLTFPGVFTGVGEFTIHKEFVSAKVSGETASLTNPALDRILDFAAEVGLVVLIHNDVDVPFPKEGRPPAYLAQMKALLKRHPNGPIIWAHCGVGRVVRPVTHHTAMLESVRITSDLIKHYPERFLFGTDEVAPPNQEKYLRVYYLYEPLWRSLSPEASRKVRKDNYERLFDEARRKVRAWEKAHIAAK